MIDLRWLNKRTVLQYREVKTHDIYGIIKTEWQDVPVVEDEQNNTPELSQAVSGNKDFKRCKQCDEWYAVDPRVANKGKGKIYCSDACKSKAWRESKKERGRLVSNCRLKDEQN